MTPNIEIELEPQGKACSVKVNGRDVTAIVNNIDVRAAIDGTSRVILSCLDVNEKGLFYTEGEEGRRDVASRNIVIENAVVTIKGRAAMDFIETRAARLKDPE